MIINSNMKGRLSNDIRSFFNAQNNNGGNILNILYYEILNRSWWLLQSKTKI